MTFDRQARANIRFLIETGQTDVAVKASEKIEAQQEKEREPESTDKAKQEGTND